MTPVTSHTPCSRAMSPRRSRAPRHLHRGRGEGGERGLRPGISPTRKRLRPRGRGIDRDERLREYDELRALARRFGDEPLELVERGVPIEHDRLGLNARDGHGLAHRVDPRTAVPLCRVPAAVTICRSCRASWPKPVGACHAAGRTLLSSSPSGWASTSSTSSRAERPTAAWRTLPERRARPSDGARARCALRAGGAARRGHLVADGHAHLVHVLAFQFAIVGITLLWVYFRHHDASRASATG